MYKLYTPNPLFVVGLFLFYMEFYWHYGMKIQKSEDSSNAKSLLDLSDKE